MLEKTIESLLNELEKKFITSLGSASAFTDRLVGKKHCASAIRQLIKEELGKRLPEEKPLLKLSTDYRFGKSTQHGIWCYNQALTDCKTAIAEYLGEGEKNSNA